MKPLSLLIFACAFLCLGFTIVTPEAKREHERFCERARKYYGEEKLIVFIKEAITKNPEFGGARLDKSIIGKKWEAMHWNPFWHMTCGDWAMKASARKNKKPDASFTMVWCYDWATGDAIFITGHRDKKTAQLVFDGIRKDALIEINWE
ncbi:MAG: hypothetical protein LBM92_06240 [Opitutaceae bacterium]|nr:hypothetical protein [Opitutaceae bacterium]